MGELTWRPEGGEVEVVYVAGLTSKMASDCEAAVASTDRRDVLTLPQISTNRHGPFRAGIFRADLVLGFRVLS